MHRTEVNIPGGDIALEGIWQTADTEGKYPAVIICHPHPLHGGDMHNYVVSAVSRALLARSISTLRFNFRGVGRSGGTYGEGVGEQDDVRAAIDFVDNQKSMHTPRLGLAGYSFGSGVSIPVAANDKRVRALALISPAITVGGWEMLRQLTIPKLLITGSEDRFFLAQQLEADFKNILEPKQLHVIVGADHFWQGIEAEVAEKVGQFFQKNL